MYLGNGRRKGSTSLDYAAYEEFDRESRERFLDDLADVVAVERASFGSFLADLLGFGSMEERDDGSRDTVEEAFREQDCGTIRQWVSIGMERDAFDETRDVAESLLYEFDDRPFTDQQFRPFREAGGGWYKDVYVSEDGETLELRPKQADRIRDYETAFENAMQSCLAYRHNARALQEYDDLDAPDLDIVVADDHRVEEQRPWPYAVVELVEGADRGFLDRFIEKMRVGMTFQDAYREQQLSYASADEGMKSDNFTVGEDGPVVLDVGEYVNGRSREVLDESEYVPDEWRMMCEPGYWG